MKGLGTTIGLVVVLAALGAYIYFVPTKPADQAETKEKAFTVKSEEIQELRIKAADGETTRIEMAGGRWRLVEPVQADADTNEVSAIITNLSTLEVQRVIEEKPANLAEYGLEPARVDVAFRSRGETEFRHLLMGEKSPAGGDFYAKAPESPRVFLISPFLDNTFNRTAFDLREKAVLKYNREAVDTIDIAGRKNSFRFVKREADWLMEKPYAARVEFSSIEGFLGALSTTQVQRFIDGDPGPLSKYGLDSPDFTVSVRGGGTSSQLLIGDLVTGTYYAKDAGRPGVFTLGSNFISEIEKDPGEFRRKNVFDSRSFSTTKAEFKRAAVTKVLTKSKGKDDADVWQLDGRTVDTVKAEDPLMKFSNLRADVFQGQPHPSLKSPELTVTVTFDGRTETVVFARAGADVYASRSDEPGSAKVPAAEYDTALKALDDLK